MIELDPGKMSIIIDGQFGSTGKGLLASYVAVNNHIDFVVSNSSANAGHTFYYHNKKHIVKQLPVAGIINSRSTIVICAGAIINPRILLAEIEQFNIDPCRIAIHPRVAIITQEDIDSESKVDAATTKLASTQSGVGMALSRKINRTAILAQDIPELKPYIKEICLSWYLLLGCTALMEVSQGFDLSISSGYAYPYCTSREITVSAAMADAQLHPFYLGKVIVCLRTFPIRVGNIVNDGGGGVSGPFYDDSEECSWEDIGVQEEYTTVTGRVRRVATFSMKQYHKMLEAFEPDYILLNFANYLSNEDLKVLIDKLPEITHLGYGPKIENISKRY